MPLRQLTRKCRARLLNQSIFQADVEAIAADAEFGVRLFPTGTGENIVVDGRAVHPGELNGRGADFGRAHAFEIAECVVFDTDVRGGRDIDAGAVEPVDGIAGDGDVGDGKVLSWHVSRRNRRRNQPD